jgi:hypothetical protein
VINQIIPEKTAISSMQEVILVLGGGGCCILHRLPERLWPG